MATVRSFGLALCMLAAAYVTFRCNTPPNPPPVKPGVKDRIATVATPRNLNAGRNGLLLLWLYHILLTVAYPHVSPAICPHPDSLNPKLFSWSIRTAICIAMVLIGGKIRLTAFKQLGENFTFQLAKPKSLVKHGLYSYMQHPSYVGHLLVVASNLLLIGRQAGVFACWLPGILDIPYLGVLFSVAPIVLGPYVMHMRVHDEERMLKKEFGKEWEEYHTQTKRFIPGLF